MFIPDPDFFHPDPGVKKGPDPGSGSATICTGAELVVLSYVVMY
jgi:hypothetical protein